MPLVAAICTQCGANIEVDDTKEAGICKYCGTAFITEKAINNYNTYITNNYTTNNNFAGANVIIQQNIANVDGLLRIAKKELLSKYYRSNDLIDALKNIIIQSTDGEKQILDLFHEVGMYDLAEKAIQENDYSMIDLDMISLLTKYDSDNIVGWILKWNWGHDSIPRSVTLGKNILRLAKNEDKSKYEKKVYSYFVTHGPRCDAYKEYLSAVPKEYINDNKFIQDLILSSLKEIQSWQTDYREDKVKLLTEMLPESRRAEIYRPQLSGGCYVATCVYGSYDCPEVWTLRRFRDYTLDATWYGRFFIKCYYVISPNLVKWFGETKWFRSFWKVMLDKIVLSLNIMGFNNTYYQDK